MVRLEESQVDHSCLGSVDRPQQAKRSVVITVFSRLINRFGWNGAMLITVFFVG
jgi:hypothetical protein